MAKIYSLLKKSGVDAIIIPNVSTIGLYGATPKIHTDYFVSVLFADNIISYNRKENVFKVNGVIVAPENLQNEVYELVSKMPPVEVVDFVI